jgi:hypothetical protein
LLRFSNCSPLIGTVAFLSAESPSNIGSAQLYPAVYTSKLYRIVANDLVLALRAAARLAFLTPEVMYDWPTTPGVNLVTDKQTTPVREREADVCEIRLLTRIRELEAENAALRNAAGTFAELADRLNERLRSRQQSASEHPAADD